MLVDEQKEFELLVKSIEEASKHARNLLFVLVVSSIYVLISAFSVAVTEKLTLPALGVDVSTLEFFAISPVVIVGIYLYMHIYVNQLIRRLQIFDSLNIECKTVTSPRMLLFPWLLIFATTPFEERSGNRISGESLDISRRRPRLTSTYVYLVSGLTIWCLGPVVLFALWVRFIGQEQLISIIPCICLIISLFVLSSPFTRGRLVGSVVTFSGLVLILITFASVPEYRTLVALDTLWSFLRENSDAFLNALQTGLMTLFGGFVIGQGLDTIFIGHLEEEDAERITKKLLRPWTVEIFQRNRFGAMLVDSAFANRRPLTLIFVATGVVLGVLSGIVTFWMDLPALW